MVKAQKPISMDTTTIEKIDEYSKENELNFSEAAEKLIVIGYENRRNRK